MKGLVDGRLIAAGLVILGTFILGTFAVGNAYAAGYTGNPYAPQTQYTCTHEPYYHCTMSDPSATQNPYAYQNPYGYTAYPPGYGAGYIAGGGYNVNYYNRDWRDRDGRFQGGDGAIVNHGGGAMHGGNGRGR